MNTKVIIGIVAIIVVAAAGVGIYSLNSSRSEIVTNDAVMQKKVSVINQEKDTATMVKKDGGAVMTKAGSYEAYSPEKIAQASSKGNVVLFFRASWCPTCIAVDKDIKANLNAIPESLTILDVNYDKLTELKKKYGVTYQHTFVQVDVKGNLIKKWSGSPTLVSLVSEIK